MEITRQQFFATIAAAILGKKYWPLVKDWLTPKPTFRSIRVVARPRKLKANWTLETAQDLRAIHGLEAEEELAEYLEPYIRYDTIS
jgi:hypothetical protein